MSVPANGTKSNLLARVCFRGQHAFFLIHVENQTQFQGDFARRMFRYFARLHEKHGLPVYPIALFSHEAPRVEPDEYVVQFPRREVLHFTFRCIQLQRLNWRDYLRQANPVAAALMARMGMAPQERARVKLECLRLLTKLQLDHARQRLISGFVDTYLRLDAAEALQFASQADTILGDLEKERIMELTTSWKEEGRAEGELSVVVRLLRRRFGPALPPSVGERVRGLSSEQLGNLAEALLDFTSIADLENWFMSLPRRVS